MKKELVRKEVGARLRELRENQNLTTRELAELAKLDYSHIAKIERGVYNLRIDTLHQVAAALGKKIKIE